MSASSAEDPSKSGSKESRDLRDFATPLTLIVAGLVIFVLFAIPVVLFYRMLGASLSDVGISYVDLLTKAILINICALAAITIPAVLIMRYIDSKLMGSDLRTVGRARKELAEALSSRDSVTFLDQIDRIWSRTPLLGKCAKDGSIAELLSLHRDSARGIIMAEAQKERLESLQRELDPRAAVASLERAMNALLFDRVFRFAKTTAIWVPILTLTIGFPALAVLEAQRVKAGKSDLLLRSGLLGYSAKPVSVQGPANSKVSATLATDSSVVLLGHTDSFVVLYSVKAKHVVRLSPVSSGIHLDDRD